MFIKIKNLLLGMITVLKHLFKKPITLEYPERTIKVGEYFRGKPIVNPTCIKCGTCKKVCPADAIQFDNDIFKIDLKRCIFCGNCSYYCPVKAIRMSDCYELATKDHNDLNLLYSIEKQGGENGMDN